MRRVGRKVVARLFGLIVQSVQVDLEQFARFMMWVRLLNQATTLVKQYNAKVP